MISYINIDIYKKPENWSRDSSRAFIQTLKTIVEIFTILDRKTRTTQDS